MIAMPILSICVSCRPFLKFLVPRAERCLYSATRHGSSSVLAKIKSKPRSVQPIPLQPKMKVKPFVKDMFFGNVDGRLLAYPELDLARYQALNDMAAEVQAFLDNVNIDTQGKISDEVWLGLKQLGLFGMSIPKEYGGLGFSNIEMTRLFEVVGCDSSLFYALNSHHTQVVPTLLCGNEQQKQEYLPQLASGNLVCGFALWEKDAGVDLSRINCRAVQVGDEYILEGSKCWVGNANVADKFLVLAKTKILSNSGQMVDSHTCLLVDKHSVGISTKSMDTVGVKGFDLYEVTFNQTVVPAKNVIGDAGHAGTIVTQLVNSSHTFLVSVAATVLKNLLDITTKHVINRELFNQPLYEYELVKQTLAQVAQRIYTIESMAFFTAGILDFCEDPDTVVEAAIMKVYSAESLVWGVQKCLSLLGSHCYLRDFPYDQILRDAQFALIAEGTSDTLRLFICLMGLQYVSANYSEEVVKTRNPHFYPKEALSKAISSLFKSSEVKEVDVNNKIIEDLHPSMKQSAAYLDWCVQSLAHSTKNFFLKYGNDGQYKQMDMVRLADVAIECYAQAAVASRASRSYCLGLNLCVQEVLVSQSVSYDAYQRVKQLVNDLKESPYLTNDANHLDIANHLISSKGYTMPHPLTRAY